MHLRYAGATVEAKSKAGEMATKLLDLNDPGAIAYRHFILDTLQTYTTTRIELERTRTQLQELRSTGSVKEAEANARSRIN